LIPVMQGKQPVGTLFPGFHRRQAAHNAEQVPARFKLWLSAQLHAALALYMHQAALDKGRGIHLFHRF
jgi:hypothetical protein